MIVRASAQPLPELGVIGWPLHRTFSPPMFAAALAEAGLGWRYESIPVAPDDLPAFMSRACQEMRGFNVTIPHKAAVAAACTLRDDVARSSGAVNTVVCALRNGKKTLEGCNTDGPGLLKALMVRGGFDPRGSNALILGSGGAAAGCAAALAGRKAARITVANRTLRRAADLVERLEALYPATEWFAVPVAVLPAVSPGHRTITGADLVINCIPEEPASGLGGLFESMSGEHPVFCDMSYSGAPSRLMMAARDAACRLVPGLEVLLWQGVYGYEILTGSRAPEETMRDALTAVAGKWWLNC
ncbi:MAG: shikimate dehydrogenase family protein [Ignavibacteriales bacterium]